MRRQPSLSVSTGIALCVIGSITCFLPLRTSFTSIVALKGPPSGQALAARTETQKFTWKKISPCKQFVWHDCYSGLQCARLLVPLNYSDPNGSQAAIATIRIRSSYPVDSPLYKGPIIVNPGGPGGSGVDFIVTTGNLISAVVGPQFDLVSFDPRGIARSTPRVSFFEPLERALWGADAGGPEHAHVLNTSIDGIAREWARAQITNGIAADRQLNLLPHINTDQTARDMLRIVQAHGRDMIQYWGFSYGSVLGATFAAMFPERIERLVIDGVVDARDYYGASFLNFINDTDKTLQHFFDGCHAAGPSSCPFYAPSPHEIAKNLSSIFDALRTRPIPVRTPISYGLVDYNRLKMTIFDALYSPYASFLPLAEALSDLAAGKGERLFNILGVPKLKCDSESNDDPDATFFPTTDEFTAVTCNDAAEVFPKLKDFENFFKKITEKSQWGELWSSVGAFCIGWQKFSKTNFRGPVTGNTSFPILLIGNTADPVTPLQGAKNVARGFPGSVVLTQDGPGHCSLSAPSPCTAKHVRDYFLDGTLPPPGTICPVIGSPFSPPPSQLHPQSKESAHQSDLYIKDREMLEITRALSSRRRVGPPFGSLR